MPGRPAGTTKDLMPPRPALVDRGPHDDEAALVLGGAFAGGAEDLGAVQHPLLVSSSKSAVVWMAAASEPAWGSVIAMAPQIGCPLLAEGPRKLLLLLLGAGGAATAEPPSAGVGMRR